MTRNISNGKNAELIALDFLKKNSYEILETNWRYKKLEADIICKKNELLIFVEVKMRSSALFGHPVDFVDHKKQKNLISLAEAYLEENNYSGEIRFDIISILKINNTFNIEHIKDAFWSDNQ